ncbi:MAG: TIGR00266 family protein [Methylomarinum sp.]|nr:TIGR00266 family protein [Methylomarinum sp.]
MRCHEVDYTIIGHDIQMVEIELDSDEAVIAEAGAMTYLEQDITFEAKMGDGSDTGVMSKLFGLGKRMLTGESVFLTHFTNDGNQKRHVAFSAPFPGSIIALNLAELGEEVTCQKDSFLAAALGTQVDVAFHKRLGSGFFGGEGFILQRLRGDGMAFIHAGGTVVKKELNNETLRLDTGCLVGFSGDIDYSIEMSGGLKSMLFGGEGLFLATLSGTGSVWVQSMPFSRLAERVLSHAVASTQGEN